MRNVCTLIICCTLVMLVGCQHEGKPDPTIVDQTVKATPPAPAPFTFAPCWTGLPEHGMWKSDPVFQDVNADGHPDLAAIARLGDGAHVWLGDGQGVWQDSSIGLNPGTQSCGGGLAFADFNEDGRLDLAVADHCRGAYVFVATPAGAWEMVTKSLYPSDMDLEDTPASMFLGAEDLDAGDLNGDGHADLVVGASDQGGISVYLGDGTGANWTRVAQGLPQSGWANRVQLVDIDGDDVLDIVAACDAGPRVFINEGKATFWETDGFPSPTLKGIYTGIAVGDVDEDGRLDVVVANWFDGPEVYLQDADRLYWRKTEDVFPTMQGGAVGLDLNDLDGDGHLDLVVSGRLTTEGGFVRGVYSLQGDGSGNWRYIPNSGLPTTGLAATTGVALGDLNGDGLLDVAACSGLIVETVPGTTEPAIAARLLVWCGQGPEE